SADRGAAHDRRSPGRGRPARGAPPPRRPPRMSTPSLSWDPIHDVHQLLAFPFMVNALEAGTIVAVLAAVVGWYMVLRRQSFAGHTLSVMAFPGAAGAALAGLPTAVGYYAACGGAALLMRRGPGSIRRGYASETATIAT